MSGLALLCPGQGNQHPAMLDLALAHPRGADVVRRATAAAGLDLVAAARGGGPDPFTNAVAQPLLCAAELATWAALAPAVPSPRAVLGYSLGELAAHGCAGALGVEDVVRLAARRAALMDAAAPPGGGLVALRGFPLARAEALAAAAGAELAIVNGPEHCVAGGDAAAVDRLEAAARAAGAATVQRLPIAVPAHTRWLAAAVAPFAAALTASALVAPAVPVLAGVSGAPVRTRAEAITALSSQLAARIEWARCLATAAELGNTVFLELGPGAALARMVSEALPGVAVRSVADFRTVAGVARWVEAALART
jgi:[acyl-carrier-protein] S-malonyltransferase